jgi:hypothetical protein
MTSEIAMPASFLILKIQDFPLRPGSVHTYAAG